MFPQYMHLTSDGKHIVVFDVETSSLVELDMSSAAIVEEALIHGGFDETTYEAARKLLHLRGVTDSEFIQAKQVVEELLEKGLFAQRDHAMIDSEDILIPHSAITLNVSQKCQLNCTYCFAAGGSYGGSSLISNMSSEIGRKAIDLISKIVFDKAPRFTISYFGGEPLLNWELIEELTLYAEQKAREIGKKVGFSITTNAIAIDEMKAKFLADHQFGVIVSLDGNEELHNRLRPHKDERVNSYAETIKGIELLRRHCSIGCRATVTSSFANAGDLDSYLREAGATVAYLAPVSSDSCDSLILDGISLRTYVASLSESFFSEDHDRLMPIRRIKKQIEDGYKSPWGCGFAYNTLTVDVTGSIYACHRMTSNELFCVGSVYEGLLHDKVLELRKAANSTQKLGCRSCWLRYLCASECVVENYNVTGSMSVPNSYSCYRTTRLYEAAIESYLVSIQRATSSS